MILIMACTCTAQWDFSGNTPCAGIEKVYPILGVTDVSKMDIVDGVLVSLKRKNKQGKFTGKYFKVGQSIVFKPETT